MPVGQPCGTLGRMNLQRSVACLLLAAVAAAPWSGVANAQEQAQLIATPGIGRPNDYFYLAGGGFPPNELVTVTMYCQDWTYNPYGRWSWPPLRAVPPLKANKFGNFAGSRLRVPTPLLVKRTPCVLRARQGDNPFGAAVEFKIVAAEDPLPPRAIDVKIRVRIVSSGGKITQVVDIQSAPGAVVHCTVTYPGMGPVKYTVSLPWTGHKVVRWQLPVHAGTKGRAQLTVRAVLGDMEGRSKAQFAIRS